MTVFSRRVKSDHTPEPGDPSQPLSGPDWKATAGAALLTLGVYLAAHGGGFSNFFRINEDVRQQVYWMQRWLDPGLYPDHWLTEYARQYTSWGVRALYRAGALFLHPFWFGKVVAGLLFTILGGTLFAVGRTLRDRRLAWGLLGTFWLMPVFLHNIAGGLARAFAAPLLALFLLSWMGRRARLMGLILVLEALLIPYVFLLCGTALVLGRLGGVIGFTPPPPFLNRTRHWVLLLASGVLVFAFNRSMEAAGFGPLASLEQMFGHAEYTALGRYHVVPAPSVLYEILCRPLESIAPFEECGAYGGILGVIGIAALLFHGGRRADWRVPRGRAQALGSLALASLLLFFAARILLVELFIPSRYLEYSVALGWCLVLAICSTALWRRGFGRTGGPLLVAACAVLGTMRLHNQGLCDYSGYRPVYEAVQELPRDVLIAGHPFLMDNVQTFGGRKAFLTYELSHPWSVGLWARQKPMLEEFFGAYYAADPRIVEAFCLEYGVDYMLVQERDFTPGFLKRSRAFIPWHKAVDLPLGLNGFFARLGPHWRVEVRAGGKGLPSDHPFFSPFDELIAQAASHGEFVLLQDRLPGVQIMEGVKLLDMQAFSTPEKRR